MMRFKEHFHKIYKESMDTPYSYRVNFEVEDVEDEEEGDGYMKEVFTPVQIVKFKTKDGTEVVWYARQYRYSNVMWEISFGTTKSYSSDSGYKLNIELTNSGDALRIFSTIIEITNDFINTDENYEIQELLFSSIGEKRTKFYLKYLVPRIKKFELDDVRKEGDETFVTLKRKF